MCVTKTESRQIRKSGVHSAFTHYEKLGVALFELTLKKRKKEAALVLTVSARSEPLDNF